MQSLWVWAALLAVTTASTVGPSVAPAIDPAVSTFFTLCGVAFALMLPLNLLQLSANRMGWRTRAAAAKASGQIYATAHWSLVASTVAYGISLWLSSISLEGMVSVFATALQNLGAFVYETFFLLVAYHTTKSAYGAEPVPRWVVWLLLAGWLPVTVVFPLAIIGGLTSNDGRWWAALDALHCVLLLSTALALVTATLNLRRELGRRDAIWAQRDETTTTKPLLPGVRSHSQKVIAFTVLLVAAGLTNVPVLLNRLASEPPPTFLEDTYLKQLYLETPALLYALFVGQVLFQVSSTTAFWADVAFRVRNTLQRPKSSGARFTTSAAPRCRDQPTEREEMEKLGFRMGSQGQAV